VGGGGGRRGGRGCGGGGTARGAAQGEAGEGGLLEGEKGEGGLRGDRRTRGVPVSRFPPCPFFLTRARLPSGAGLVQEAYQSDSGHCHRASCLARAGPPPLAREARNKLTAAPSAAAGVAGASASILCVCVDGALERARVCLCVSPVLWRVGV
jgi:hypothetical protein